MAKMLVWMRDVVSADARTNLGRPKSGQVIHIVPDAFGWGRKEVEPDFFRVIITDLPLARGDAIPNKLRVLTKLYREAGEPGENPYVRADRRFRLDPDALRAVAVAQGRALNEPVEMTISEILAVGMVERWDIAADMKYAKRKATTGELVAAEAKLNAKDWVI